MDKTTSLTYDEVAAFRDLVGGTRFLWPIAQRGPVLRLTFVAANTKRDVQHGMTVVPDGFFTVQSDAEVHATPGVLWTSTTAYLQTNAANGHVVGFFYKLREDPIDA